jgi:RHS repeat-associated protein
MINQRLNGNQCIISPHGQYLLFMGTDGNLFIYDLAHNVGTWWAGTSGHPGAYAIMQGDGNLCVNSATNTFLWCSGTGGTYAERVNMEDDGRIIIYKSVWNSGTPQQFNVTTMAHPGCDVGNSGLGWTGILGSGSCLVSPNGRFELLMQSDGNLVIYDRSVTPNAALWSSGTATSPADPGYAMRTLYSYDALGNLLRVEQHGDTTDSTKWRIRTFTYDSLSRLLTANNPESGLISYTYDNDGELLQKVSPAPNPNPQQPNQTVSYCYDALHRVTAKDYSPHTYTPPACPITVPVVSFFYDSGTDAIGHLTALTDQAGTASYSYDIMGRLATETRTLTGASNAAIFKTLSYDYNLDGSLYKLHYPSGNVVTYEPGAAGRTLSTKDTGNNINYVTSATYGPEGALTGFVSGNSTSFAGITNAFSYNKRLQPLNMSANAPSQTVFSIGYDFHLGNGTTGADNGNVFGITNYKDSTRSQTFTYDVLNRLASARNAGTDCSVTVLGGLKKFWGNTYTYDAWGNLLTKALLQTPAPAACAGENLSVTADAHNRIHATGGADYLYDAAGNMTFNATPPTQNYTYDQENRLTGAAGYTYTYDADGNRVRKSNGNLAANGTLYWYMAPGIVGESDLSGNLTDEYVFFGGERVARKSTNGVFYYFSDHLKTASVITDALGNIKSESDFYPWGGELQFVNNDSNHYKFTGKERDGETQLDYFGARHYSYGLGRWVSADWSPTPIPVPYADFSDPQSLNLYGFVGGNPASKADPDGHAWPPFLTEVIEDIEAFAHANPGIVASVAGPLVASATPAAPALVLAAPSVGGMTLAVVGPKYEVPEGCAGDCSSFYIPAPSAQGQGQQTQTQPQLGQGRGAGEQQSQSDIANERARTNGGITTEFHGNDHRTTKPAEGYSLRDKDTGEVLKYGETTQGTGRYSKEFLKDHNADMVFEAKGTKAEMHTWQHNKILEYKEQHDGARPPLNKSDY